MTQASQVQAFSAPIQQLVSDSFSLALEALEVSQAQGKKVLESALELGTAYAKDSLKYADELRGHFAEATNTANAVLKDQASLFNELPKDPVGATQKVIGGYVDSSRKALEVGAEALKSYVNLVNEVWARLEKASQETRQDYVAYVAKLQAILEATAHKN
jgi:hypothetical protein